MVLDSCEFGEQVCLTFDRGGRLELRAGFLGHAGGYAALHEFGGFEGGDVEPHADAIPRGSALHLGRG